MCIGPSGGESGNLAGADGPTPGQSSGAKGGLSLGPIGLATTILTAGLGLPFVAGAGLGLAARGADSVLNTRPVASFDPRASTLNKKSALSPGTKKSGGLLGKPLSSPSFSTDGGNSPLKKKKLGI
jgi:hypothetical protein